MNRQDRFAYMSVLPDRLSIRWCGHGWVWDHDERLYRTRQLLHSE